MSPTPAPSAEGEAAPASGGDASEEATSPTPAPSAEGEAAAASGGEEAPAAPTAPAADGDNNACMAHITKDAKAGDTSVEVSVESCYSVGQELIIAKETENEETVVIAGFGSLILKDPLVHDHASGTLLSIDGATAPLTAAGFKAVTSMCCPPEMEVFFTRLLDSMRLQVCSNVHVQGLMHWFSCVPDMDYQYMIEVINNGNPCKYWAGIGATCPALSPECAGEYCR